MSEKVDYPKVSVILLVYRKWQWATRCLESLYQMDYPNYQVIVIDNCSGDETPGKIREWAEGKIRIDGNFILYDPGNKPIPYTIRPLSSCSNNAIENKNNTSPLNKSLIIILNQVKDFYYYSAVRNKVNSWVIHKFNPDYIK